jgi:putative peptide zinc metalloprotease protein
MVDDPPEPGMWEQFEADDKKLALSLFRPHGFCAFLAGALRPFRLLLLAMPLLAGVGVATVINNFPAFVDDIAQYRSPVSLIVRILFSFLTVNLVTEFARGVIAAGLHGEARMFGVRMVLGVVPRFHMSVGNIANFSRRDILWMYGGPILVRTVLFGVGIVAWWATRDSGTLAPAFAIMLSAVAVIALVFSCNPLAPNNDGYHVLAAMLQMPDLRKRANKSLISKFRKGIESDSDADRALRAYAMGSLIFLFVLLGVALWLVAHWLELNYQGTGVVIFLGLLLYMVLYMRGQIREQRQRVFQQRSEQRAEQRRRQMAGAMTGGQYRGGVPALAGGPRGGAVATAAGGGDTEHPRHRSNPLIGWLFLVVLGVVAMLPYNYQPGGPVRIMPAQQRDVHTEIAGLLEDVLVGGGEFADEGAIIARMSAQEEQRAVQSTQAEIAEQQARLEELISRPRPEDVRLAEQQLETARVQLRYSIEEVDRLEGLREDGFVSNEDYQDAVRRREVDRAEVLEAEANLVRVSTPAHPKDIEAAEANLEGLRQELAYRQGQLERTILRMPFTGRVVTINLKDKQGQYLDKGAFFATVENAESVRVQFRIPQSDVSEINVGGETLVKFWAYPGKTFTGEIVDISPAVEEEDQGEVVIVTTMIPNEDGLLKSGMTGFGKVRGERKTVLEVFSRAIVRFFLVEMWSWLP